MLQELKVVAGNLAYMVISTPLPFCPIYRAAHAVLLAHIYCWGCERLGFTQQSTAQDLQSQFLTLHTVCHVAGGTDLSESDRQDLQQLERAVRGRLLELQLLKLSAQSHKGQAQHAALLDVSSSTAQPKV